MTMLQCGRLTRFVLLATLLSTGAAAENAPTPILSLAQLEAHLAGHPGATPIDKLPAGARERFLASLRFEPAGLSSFDPNELGIFLTRDEVQALLELFGPNAVTYLRAVRFRDEAARKRLAPADPRRIGDVERRYNDFYVGRKRSSAQSQEELKVEAVRLFDTRLADVYAPRRLARVNDYDLELLWDGARGVTAYSLAPRHVEAFDRTLAERQRRGTAEPRDIESLRNLLLVAHRVDEARRLSAKYPDAKLDALPAFEEGSDASGAARTVWRFADGGRALTRVGLDLMAPQIIVTTGCHISVEAAEDISADPVLGPVFERHSSWLTKPPGSESMSDALAWHQRFPRAPLAMAYDVADWELLPSWGIPRFYIVRDGKIVETVIGWTRNEGESRRQPLIDALRRTGLLSAEGNGAE